MDSLKPLIRLGSILIVLLFLMPAVYAQEPPEKWVEEKETKLLQAEQYANEQLRLKRGVPRRKAKRQRPWTLFGKFGYEYDDNVVLASDKKEFRRNSRDISAGRYRISSGLAYDFYRKTPYRAGVSFVFNQFLHDDSLNAFNFQDYVTTVYGSRLLSLWDRPSKIDLRYSFSHGLLNRHTFSSSHFWTGSWTGEWKENWLLTVYEKLGTIDFRDKGFDKSVSSRDGFYEETGFLQTWLFDRRQRSFSFGYEFGLDETEGNNFDAIANGVKAILKTPLIEKIEFSSFFYFRVDYYRHFVVSPKRLDLRYQYEFRLSRPLGPYWTLNGFYRRADVNNLHDGVQGQFNYHRNIYGVELSFYY
jgi:hypothetical protein